MKLLTLWATRKDFEGHVPELLVAWDEHCVDNFPEGFEADCKKALDAMGDDLAEYRRINIYVPEEAIRHAFEKPNVSAVVEG